MTATGGLTDANVTAISGTFTGTGNSASFFPTAGRGFNIAVYGTFVGTVDLQKKVGATWVTKFPDSIYTMTEVRAFTDIEPEHGVEYRLSCTAYTSGTISYRLSQ